MLESATKIASVILKLFPFPLAEDVISIVPPLPVEHHGILFQK